jgi:hypothetical protein
MQGMHEGSSNAVYIQGGGEEGRHRHNTSARALAAAKQQLNKKQQQHARTSLMMMCAAALSDAYPAQMNNMEPPSVIFTRMFGKKRGERRHGREEKRTDGDKFVFCFGRQSRGLGKWDECKLEVSRVEFKVDDVSSRLEEHGAQGDGGVKFLCATDHAHTKIFLSKTQKVCRGSHMVV